MNRTCTTLTLAALTFLCASSVQGGMITETIIKLSFGSDSMPDVELIDGVLSTAADAAGATDGDQNTEVQFLNQLAGETVLEFPYSVTLEGIQLVGAPTVMPPDGKYVYQATKQGSFTLYDPSDKVLLKGTLGNGTLSGTVGSPGTGALLTTEFGEFTEGSLLGKLDGATFSAVSISLLAINGGNGFSLTSDTPSSLENFTADATAVISAQGIPEPNSFCLLLSGLFGLWITRRPGRSGRGIGR